MSKNQNSNEEHNKSLGVLYTGYVDKQSRHSWSSFKKRFLVLTHSAVHWFQRAEETDLFGEARGQVGLGSILTVRILDEDGTTFEIQTIDRIKRLFRASTPIICEEWISTIRSAIKSFSAAKNNNTKNEDNNLDTNDEVNVLLISLRSKISEIVITRNPDWQRIVNLPVIKPDDLLLISTSNGGLVTLTYDQIEMRSEHGTEFDISVQSVTLASSLKLSISNITNKKYTVTGSNNSSNNSHDHNKTNNTFINKILFHMNNSNNVFHLVLSVMVMIVGATSVGSIGPDTSLFFVFTMILAFYNFLYVTNGSNVDDINGLHSLKDLCLRIRGHAYTSPDAPVFSPEEEEIPLRFLQGCNGDEKEARRRWDVTRHWREAENVNGILQEKQPHFFTIKSMYPHYHAGRGKLGHVVYYERPGEIEQAQLAARGIGVEQMARHWLFVTEYQWTVLCGNREDEKSISILDIEKIKMGDLSGDPLAYTKKTIGWANAHYPERSYVIFIVNAPFFFTMLWKIIKPWVHENTQKKVKILSKKETLAGLQEHIELDNIPDYYGGNLKCQPVEGANANNPLTADGRIDSCRYFGSDTLAMNQFVEKINGTNPSNLFDSDGEKTPKPPYGPQAVHPSLEIASPRSLNGHASNAKEFNDISSTKSLEETNPRRRLLSDDSFMENYTPEKSSQNKSK